MAYGRVVYGIVRSIYRRPNREILPSLPFTQVNDQTASEHCLQLEEPIVLKYRGTILVGSILLLSAFASSVGANGVLDQAFEPDLSDGFVIAEIENNSRIELSGGQSFTVGVGGILSCVEVMVQNINPVAGRLVLEIQNVDGDLPNGEILATASMAQSEVPNDEPTFVNFDISAAELPVLAGDVYAIVVSSEARTGGIPVDYRWAGEFGSNGRYSGGIASSRNNGVWTGVSSVDLGFRTYVEPTTPTISTSWGQIKQASLQR